MTNDPRSSATPMALLVVGITLNTLGVVLVRAGAIRYVLMGAGLLLMLGVVVRLTSRRPESPSDSPPVGVRPDDPPA